MGKTDVKGVQNGFTCLFAKCNGITKLWNLEAIGNTDPSERIKHDELEQAALYHLRKIVHFNDDGRYEVSIPSEENKVDIPNNRKGAERRNRC